MRRIVCVCLALNFLAVTAHAQRDAPIWESHLASMSIYHEDGSSLTIELLYKKEGGPHEHNQHQMYLLAYLAKDEAEILKLASGSGRLDTPVEGKKPIVDVLIEKKLVAVLDSQVASRRKWVQDWDVYQDRGVSEKDLRIEGRSSLAVKSFAYKFNVSNDKLFEAFSRLANVRSDGVDKVEDLVHYQDRLKLLAFVPLNDSKYATKVSPELRTISDILYVLYFKPLPYELSFTKTARGKTMVYIN
jgi:hypothetical protein